MTDVARLGMAVETSDLSVAEQKLKKLVPAAKNAEDAARKLQTGFTGIGPATDKATRGTNTFAAAINNASTGTTKFSKAALGASTSSFAIASGTTDAAAKLTNLGVSAKSSGSAFQTAGTWIEAFITKLRGMIPAVNSAAAANDNLAVSMRTAGMTAGQMQSNTTNLIAQFQDIGVTASMGMNPFLIGMQQGSQAALVMQQAIGKQGLLGGLALLGKSFLATLGPITLMTIGITTFLAVFIQSVNWMKLAKSTLLAVADNFVAIASAASALGVVLAIAFAPQIIGTILTMARAIGVTLVSAIGRATLAMLAFAASNPFGALVLAIGVALGVVYAFRDDFTRMFGFDIIKSVKEAADAVARYMVATFNTIRRTWETLPDIVHDIVQNIKAELNDMGTLKGPDGSAAWKMFDFDVQETRGALANVKKIFNEEMAKTDGWSFTDTAVGAFSDFAGKIRNFANGLGGDDDKKKKGSRDPWAELVKGAEIAILNLKNEAATMHLVGEAAATARTEQELLMQAKQQDIKLTDAHRAAIHGFAVAIGQQTAANESQRKSIEDMRSAQEALVNVQTELKTAGMGNEEAARYREEMRMLNDETFRGIKYTDDHKKSMIGLAGQLANTTQNMESYKKAIEYTKSAQEALANTQLDINTLGMGAVDAAAYREQMRQLNDEVYRNIFLTDEQKNTLIDLARSQATAGIILAQNTDTLKEQEGVFKGLFTSVKSGLESGKTVWGAFADSALNALSRIGDKLMEMWLSEAFQGIMNGGAGSGGLLGGLVRGVGSLLGSNQPKPNAKGGVYGVTAFATGGVVDSPTLFGFGQGQTGLMGEAGPEAVMPLKRGSDGSLGVQMYGGGQAGAQRVAVDIRVVGEEGPMFRPYIEATSRDVAVEVTQVGLESFNQQLPDRVQQIAEDGRMR